jgi:toxin ParE1/3/4
MKPRITKHELAKTDLAEQAEYIRKDNPRAALRFLDAAEKTFEELASQPWLGGLEECTKPELAGLRCWRIRGFEKHLIFYLPVPDGIQIVRVLHGARDIKSILGK